MSIIDSDGNTTIEYQEFLRAMCDKTKLYSEKNLKALFAIIDKNKRGVINKDEIINFVVGQKKCDRDYMQNILKRLGINENSQINFEEFSKLIQNPKLVSFNESVKEEEEEEEQIIGSQLIREKSKKNGLAASVMLKKGFKNKYILPECDEETENDKDYLRASTFGNEKNRKSN